MGSQVNEGHHLMSGEDQTNGQYMHSWYITLDDALQTLIQSSDPKYNEWYIHNTIHLH